MWPSSMEEKAIDGEQTMHLDKGPRDLEQKQQREETARRPSRGALTPMLDFATHDSQHNYPNRSHQLPRRRRRRCLLRQATHPYGTDTD